MEACETFPQGIPRGMFSCCGQKNILAQELDQSAFQQDVGRRHRLVTRGADSPWPVTNKSVALSGVVQELQVAFQDDCVAGLVAEELGRLSAVTRPV